MVHLHARREAVTHETQCLGMGGGTQMELCESDDSLGYIVSSRLTMAT